jgi:hypothetical protein
MDLIRERRRGDQRPRERGEERAAVEPVLRGGDREQAERRARRGRGLSIHLDPVVTLDRARVRVVLAERADQATADPARALVAPGIARPMDDARDEIRGQRAEPDAGERE